MPKNTELEYSYETPCPFCDSSSHRGIEFGFSFPLDDEGDVYITPDHGMLMPGHLLAVTEKHLTSFAQIKEDRLSAVDWRLSRLEKSLAPQFGSYFRLEHGSDNLNGNGSGACIEHAHTHLVPADEDIGDHIQDALLWERLDEYEDLAEFRGSPYVYLGRLATHYVAANPKLPGQWVRRQIAEVRGLDNWDWALMDSTEDRRETLRRIGRLNIIRDE